MSKNEKMDSNFGGQNFASFPRKHELFLGHFFGCHVFSENSAPVLVGEAGASVRARKSLKMRTTSDKHKSPGNVGSGLLSAFGAKISSVLRFSSVVGSSVCASSFATGLLATVLHSCPMMAC